MAGEGESFGRRFKRALTRLGIFVLVLVLGAAVTFLLSQLNARRFRVVAQDDNLVVLKGRMLPVGAEPYDPPDAHLHDVYAPLPLHGAALGALAEQTFDDRDELDRALFDLIKVLAEPRLADDSPEGTKLQEGLYYLHRAQLLQGVTPEQRKELTRMQTDIAFYRSRAMLAQAQKLIQDATEQLNLAAKAENPHQHAAQQMLLQIEAPARSLDEGVRRALHDLSAPRPPPPPTPTPPPPPEVLPEPAPAILPPPGTVPAGDAGAATPDAGG